MVPLWNEVYVCLYGSPLKFGNHCSSKMVNKNNYTQVHGGLVTDIVAAWVIAFRTFL